MIFTKDDREKSEPASACHICKKDFARVRIHCHKEFEDEISCAICPENYNADVMARDHCYILGHFRGAAYRIKRSKWRLLILFHSIRGYYGHLLLRAVKEPHGKVRVMPNKMERYLVVSIGRVQFLDSFQFTMKSVAELVTTWRVMD